MMPGQSQQLSQSVALAIRAARGPGRSPDDSGDQNSSSPARMQSPEMPWLLFFRKTPADLIGHPPLASPLQL